MFVSTLNSSIVFQPIMTKKTVKLPQECPFKEHAFNKRGWDTFFATVFLPPMTSI